MSDSKELGFAIPNFDWNTYAKIRPSYPDSLFSRIFRYHREHGGRFNVAHDAGAGAGIASTALATAFDQVIVSDPNEDYIEAAKARISFFPNNSKFEFRRSRAEDQGFIADGSLDLLTICTAIGYTNIDEFIRETSRVLCPGGTFVAVSYSGWPSIVNNRDVVEAWTHFGDQWVRRGILDGSPVARRGFQVTWKGYDCIPLPEEMFEPGAIRLKINERFRTENDLVERMPELDFPVSQVGDSDVLLEEEDLRSWTRDYSLADLKQYVKSMAYSPGKEAEDALWEKIDLEMKRAQQSTLRLQWSVHMIFATKRKDC